jgi:hypothetical protein
VRIAADGLLFGESPRWRDGALWVSDWGAHEVLRFDATGQREVVARVASFPMCIEHLPDGRLLIVDSAGKRLLRREPDGTLAQCSAPGLTVGQTQDVTAARCSSIRLVIWPTFTPAIRDFGLTTEEGESFGLSVFLRDGDKAYRTYFTTGRGVEALGSVWTFLDLTPLGRQEVREDSPDGWPQTRPYAWWRRHDEYEAT